MHAITNKCYIETLENIICILYYIEKLHTVYLKLYKPKL